jgi:hypothetical protein
MKESETTLNFNLLENILPLIQCDSYINCICLTQKNLVIGQEDGKIKIHNKYTMALENTFSNHKGGITNICFINRPISQYGLNFNSKVEEVVVKPLKKPSMVYNESVFIRKSMKEVNYVEQFLNCTLDNYSDTNNLELTQQRTHENKINAEFLTTKNLANSDASKLNDVNFLKKKLNEAYSLLNKNNI